MFSRKSGRAQPQGAKKGDKADAPKIVHHLAWTFEWGEPKRSYRLVYEISQFFGKARVYLNGIEVLVRKYSMLQQMAFSHDTYTIKVAADELGPLKGAVVELHCAEHMGNAMVGTASVNGEELAEPVYRLRKSLLSAPAPASAAPKAEHPNGAGRAEGEPAQQQQEQRVPAPQQEASIVAAPQLPQHQQAAQPLQPQTQPAPPPAPANVPAQQQPQQAPAQQRHPQVQDAAPPVQVGHGVQQEAAVGKEAAVLVVEAAQPSAPPFDTQAFYTKSPNSAQQHDHTTGADLWENDVVADDKWEEAQQEEEEEDVCVLCWEEPKETTLAPCGHRALCLACTEKVLAAQKICPVCRGSIQCFIKREFSVCI